MTFWTAEKLDFQIDILNSRLPVLIFATATWSGPAKLMRFAINEIEKKYDYKIVVCIMDVDESSDLSRELDIRTCPTVIILKNGVKVAERGGSQTTENLSQMIDQIL